MASKEPMMQLRTEVRGSTAVLTIAGECDMSEAARLAAALRDVADGMNEVQVVLSGLEFLDSSTLQVLHRASSELARARSRLVLVAPTPAIRRVLQIARLEGHFEIRESLEDLPFTEGGGSRSETKDERRSALQPEARQSTAA